MPGKCEKCGGDKPKGRGRRLCDECQVRPPRIPGVPRPCRSCGSTENKGYRTQLCRECREIAEWRWDRRKKARRATRERKPCRGCGRPKGEGHRRVFCDACQKRRNTPVMCNECGVEPIRQKHAKLCAGCKEKSRQHSREYQRLRNKEYRKAGRIKPRKATPAQRKVINERRRLVYRLRAEEAGRAVREAPQHRRVAQSSREGERLPAFPLRPHLEKWCEKHEGEWNRLVHPSLVRRISEIRNTNKQSVTLDVADRLCAVLDLPLVALYPLQDEEALAA